MLSRYREFTEILTRHAGEPLEARLAAVQEFHGSYFVYYFLGPLRSAQ
jgi:hypothetical protein